MSVTTDPRAGAATIRTKCSGDVVQIALDRPRSANALDSDTVEALLSAIDQAARAGTRALVLRGEGRHFCAGFDMSEALTSSEGDLLLRFIRIEQLLQRLRRAPFLTIACVRGKAIGAGADIVAACAHRLVDPGTTLRFPGFRFGVALGTRHLGEVVGIRVARELLLESREVDAASALQIGLATSVVEGDHQATEAERIVAAMDGLDGPSVSAVLDRTLPSGDAEDAADMATLVTSLTRPRLHARLAGYLGASRA
jgi:enoyl-CoA hydratase/carnithine racemase